MRARTVVIEGQGHPVGDGFEVSKDPKRGSFEAVMDILQGKERLRQAKEELRGDFLAKSSKAAQKTKREQVMMMARASLGEGRQVFPLQLNTIEDVAAAIKAGGRSSGDQYLNEKNFPLNGVLRLNGVLSDLLSLSLLYGPPSVVGHPPAHPFGRLHTSSELATHPPTLLEGYGHLQILDSRISRSRKLRPGLLPSSLPAHCHPLESGKHDFVLQNSETGRSFLLQDNPDMDLKFAGPPSWKV